MLATAENIRAAKIEKARRLCRKNFPTFFKKFPPQKNYMFGEHTRIILDVINRAVNDLAVGKSSYTIINVPFRHGKSDIVSRRAPVWALIRDPALEIILASYSIDLATKMSRDARRCMETIGHEFGVQLSQDKNQAAEWETTKGGGLKAVGLGSSVTGRGAGLLLIDDVVKNREEAESSLHRDKTWGAFTTDLMSRLAPAHAVVIVMTRYHEDDLCGRIIRRNDSRSADYDPAFPQFTVIKMPAIAPNGDTLFPERFPRSWYDTERSALGAYAWNALGLQDPKPRTGNMLRADLVKVVDKMPEGLRWVRGWDVASSEKERTKDDPDYTVGTLAAYKDKRLYIKHVVKGQWSALKRNQVILDTAERDRAEGAMRVNIEAVAGYKDTYETIRAMLSAKASVRPVHPQKDKVSRATVIEPLFEAGEVYIQRADWNSAWIDEFTAFPSGRHDDQVDSLVIAIGDEIKRPTGGFGVA